MLPQRIVSFKCRPIDCMHVRMRAWLMKRRKANSLENIMWSELGKQNIQAEKVHCNLSYCKFMRKKKIGTSKGFEPMAAALALQCWTNCAMKNHTLGAGQFVEFILIREWNETWNGVNCAVYFRSSRNLHSMSQKSLRKFNSSQIPMRF